MIENIKALQGLLAELPQIKVVYFNEAGEYITHRTKEFNKAVTREEILAMEVPAPEPTAEEKIVDLEQRLSEASTTLHEREERINELQAAVDAKLAEVTDLQTKLDAALAANTKKAPK